MKILSLKEYKVLESEIRKETLEALNEADIYDLTPEEIDALVFLQVISVDERIVINEGLFDFVRNPIAATKLTNNAKQLAQVLTTKYKVEDEFDDKIADAESSKKEPLKKLKMSKITILKDKEDALNDRMDTLSGSSAGLGKMATLLKLRAKIKAAEAGIQDKDERADKLSQLKPREAATAQSLKQIGQEAKTKEAEKSKEEKQKPAQAQKQESEQKPAKVESLEDEYSRIKSERQQDESVLSGMKEKLTGRSVAGQNGILEKIAGKQAQLKDAKLSDQKKEQIRKEIDALNSEAEKLRAEIADFEEGVKDTRRIESEVYDKLQSAKKDAA
jgi:chromosome segregation ATPase